MNHINVETVTDVVQYTDGWSVEDINGEAHLGDMGEMTFKVPGEQTVVHWFEHNAWQITSYALPESERMSAEDHMPDFEVLADFDWMIDAVKGLREQGMHDIAVTEFQDGAPIFDIDLANYVSDEKDRFLLCGGLHNDTASV